MYIIYYVKIIAFGVYIPRAWSCNAVADLRLLNHKEGGEPFVRSKNLRIVGVGFVHKRFWKLFLDGRSFYVFFKEIQHLFFSKENDWGFSHFMTLNVSHISPFVYFNIFV